MVCHAKLELLLFYLAAKLIQDQLETLVTLLMYRRNLKFLKKLDKLNKNISRITLDAFSYCLLAEGKLDAVIESNLKIYDVAAIIPIVENAGGFITTWNNKNAEKAGNILATSNKKLHYKLLKILKS